MAAYLSEEEKKEVRPFWEEVFSEDGGSFLDYYETWKYPVNRILGEIEGSRLVSMVHRNPYELALGKGRAVCDYIVAVATRKDRRHRGLMAGLLKKMGEDMNREGMPLCFLMPAAEAIYTPFGFTNIWEKESYLERPLPEGVTKKEIAGEEYGLLAELVTETLGRTKDIFALRTEKYFKDLAAQLGSEGGGLFWLIKDGERAGYVSGWKDGKIHEKVLWKPLPSFWTVVKEGRTIMARIMCIPSFLGFLRSREKVSFLLQITDPLIEENNRTFLWEIGPERSVAALWEEELKAAEAAGKGSSFVAADISSLTAWLCGFCPVEKLLDKGAIRGNQEKLELVVPFSGVFLPEEV